MRQAVGIAIVAENAFVRAADRGLGAVDVSGLFRPHAVYVALRKEGLSTQARLRFH